MSTDEKHHGGESELISLGRNALTDNPLGLAVAGLVADLGVVDLRSVLAAALRFRARGRDGVALLLVVAGLRAGDADQHPVYTADEYEQWRTGEPRPGEYPSAEFILAHCTSWGRALTLAGLELDPASRLARRNRPELAFTRVEAADSIRAWIAKKGDQNLTFGAYRAWALERMADDKSLEMPINPRTFIKLFGGWDAAVDHAYPAATRARADTRERQDGAVRERMLRDLRRAFPDPQERKARGRYDAWAKEQPAEPDGWRPKSSFAYLRRFGSWSNAVAEADA